MLKKLLAILTAAPQKESSGSKRGKRQAVAEQLRQEKERRDMMFDDTMDRLAALNQQMRDVLE